MPLESGNYCESASEFATSTPRSTLEDLVGSLAQNTTSRDVRRAECFGASAQDARTVTGPSKSRMTFCVASPKIALRAGERARPARKTWALPYSSASRPDSAQQADLRSPASPVRTSEARRVRGDERG